MTSNPIDVAGMTRPTRRMQLQMRLTPEDKKRLRELAEMYDMSMTEVVRVMIGYFLTTRPKVSIQYHVDHRTNPETRNGEVVDVVESISDPIM